MSDMHHLENILSIKRFLKEYFEELEGIEPTQVQQYVIASMNFLNADREHMKNYTHVNKEFERILERFTVEINGSKTK